METSDQDEILIVVDAQDNVVDYLPRARVHEKKLLHRTISIVTFNSEGKIVLQRRSNNKDTYPGMLGNAVGGHVTKEESYLDAAKNEALEELNIDIEPEFLGKAIINDPLHRTMTSIFKITHDGPYDFNKEEIDEIIILSLEEIKEQFEKLSESTKIVFKELGIV